MQAERALGLVDELGDVVLVVDGKAAFGEDDLGGALDEFLRAADRERRVVDDRPLDPVEVLADRGRVLQSNQRDLG